MINWTSVKESLPGLGVEVICYNKADKTTHVAILGITGRSFYFVTNGEPIVPTHWAPLSEPATEEKMKEGALTAGIKALEVDHHGELELQVEVDEHKAPVFLSREIWEAFGDQAGWADNIRTGILCEAHTKLLQRRSDQFKRPGGNHILVGMDECLNIIENMKQKLTPEKQVPMSEEDK